MSNTEWKNISFSFDLIRATFYHLEFLEKFNELSFIDDEARVKKAIYRYEKIWLPFYSSKPKKAVYVPPVDVLMVWHLHMLAPISYTKDCIKVCGRVLDWDLMSLEKYEKLKYKTEPAWTAYSKEPYDQGDDTTYEAYDSLITYNILLASGRQRTFYHQVCLPHYKDPKFIDHGFIRYKKFLNLKRLFPKEFVVPCFLIDLLWHTHQLHPLKYQTETKEIIGFTLPHDDSVNDRSDGSLLNTSFEKMKINWSKVIATVRLVMRFHFFLFVLRHIWKNTRSMVECFEDTLYGLK
jgi:hypothetical protein